MGDRAHVGIRTSDNDTIYLYLHWGGLDRHQIMSHAISHAMSRDNDESYFTRILISRVIAEDNDKYTGVGMSVNRIMAMGDGYDIPIYDYTDKTVSVYEEDWEEGIGGVASEPRKVYDRDEYLADFAIRGVGSYA